MSEILVNLWLADGDLPDLLSDPRMWMVVIFGIAGAIGSLFKKKAADQKKRDRAEGIQPPPGRAPAPPRRAQVQPSPTPLRREPPRPGPAPAARPVPAERPRQHLGDAYTLEELRAAARRARSVQVEHPPAPVATGRPVALEAEEPTEEVLLVEPVDQRRHVRAGLRRLLGDRSGLQTGFVLSEVLSRPVALRDDHLR